MYKFNTCIHMDNSFMYGEYQNLLLLIHPFKFIFSFFFLSSFQTLKGRVTA